jgi:hypothetical protein
MYEMKASPLSKVRFQTKVMSQMKKTVIVVIVNSVMWAEGVGKG